MQLLKNVYLKELDEQEEESSFKAKLFLSSNCAQKMK